MTQKNQKYSSALLLCIIGNCFSDGLQKRAARLELGVSSLPLQDASMLLSNSLSTSGFAYALTKMQCTLSQNHIKILHHLLSTNSPSKSHKLLIPILNTITIAYFSTTLLDILQYFAQLMLHRTNCSILEHP
uniref:Uncharacterized protein n=1 Tax=Zonotrichia albicollis TaxID=44394 RepID=A0A8D2M0T1_ZONAL